MSEIQEGKTQSALYEKILLSVIIMVAVVEVALTILNVMDKINLAEWIDDLIDVFFWSLSGLYYWRKGSKSLAVFLFVTSGLDIIFALISFIQWVKG